MSSTGSLRRTERAPLSARVSRATAWRPPSPRILLTTIMVSFRPFQPGGAELTPASGGDIVNQLGFGSLGAISIFSLMAFANPQVVRSLLQPVLAADAGLLHAVGGACRPTRLGAARAAFFTLIGIMTMATILALPRDADAFSAKLVIFTDRRRHGPVLCRADRSSRTWRCTRPTRQEPEHAGLWRGVFTHKNIAGPVMACFSFAGLYLCRRGCK